MTNTIPPPIHPEARLLIENVREMIGSGWNRELAGQVEQLLGEDDALRAIGRASLRRRPWIHPASEELLRLFFERAGVDPVEAAASSDETADEGDELKPSSRTLYALAVNGKHVGDFGVDSGQVMIVDPCYLDKWDADVADVDPDNPGRFKDWPWNTGTGEFSYSGACRMTLRQKAGQLNCPIEQPRDPKRTTFEAAVVSITGWGDGCYPVFALFSPDGRVMGLFIEFMTVEEEYGDDEEDES